MKCLCHQCFGEMEIEQAIINQGVTQFCSMCTDKPINKTTDGISVGHSLVRNERQLKT